MEPDEFDEVCQLSADAFDDQVDIPRLLHALQQSWSWEDAMSFVAEDEGELIGHVLYNHAFVDAPEHLLNVLVLSPVSVRPDRQRAGVGTRLINESMSIVALRDEPLVFLEGDPRYYRRFGFVPGSGLGFTAPSVRIPDPAFMVHLLPNYNPSMTGAVVYPDAFWRTDSVGLR